ncbi:MAG: TonB-dependent receptor [Gammaproteobacteria bacterium]|nr:TonB-dependent receptor [Gammaproteobacteria bacterium]
MAVPFPFRRLIRASSIRGKPLRPDIRWLLRLAIALCGALAASWAATASAEEIALEEIVVTATKRTENLQDVPISVGVVTGEFVEMYDIVDLGDFQSYVPGLQVQKTFGSWAVRVRGLGSAITNLAFDSSVPVFNDDVYCARGKCLESAFLDVDRIEVARGPQGALFGKSTMSGAISITSAAPTDEFEASAKASYEVEDDSYGVSGFVSGPLADAFRARLAFSFDDVGGWVSNPYVAGQEPTEDRWALRATFDWDAAPNTLVRLKLEAGDSETDGRSNQLVAPGLMTAISSDPAPEFKADDIRRVSTGVGSEDYYNHDWKLATLTVDRGLGEHTLTGILSYWETETAWRLDVDGGPDYALNTDLRDAYDQVTSELRLLSPTGQRFEYIVGGWYQASDLSTQQFSPFSPSLSAFFGGVILGVPPFLIAPESAGGAGADRHIKRDQDAWSAYAQLTWNLSDRVRVIGDIRYTDETQDGEGYALSATFPDQVNPVHTGQQYLFQAPDYRFFQKRTDDSLDPALRAQFDLNDDLMLYLGFSRGSKAGGMKANDQNIGTQTLNACADPAWCQRYAGRDALSRAELAAGVTLRDGNATFDYEDEKAESFEVGAKMTLLDGRANLNIAAYTMQFDDLQTSSYDGTRFIINNAASAEVEGFEIEAVLQATESLRMNAAVAWVDATYDDFNQAQCPVGADGDQLDPSCIDGQADLSGQQLERVPEWEANVNLDWRSELANGMQLLAFVSLFYSDDYAVRQDFSPLGTQDSFVKWDARLALAAADGRWEFGVTGRNLSNEYVIQHAYEILGDAFVSLARGRTVTADLVFRF